MTVLAMVPCAPKTWFSGSNTCHITKVVGALVRLGGGQCPWKSSKNGIVFYICVFFSLLRARLDWRPDQCEKVFKGGWLACCSAAKKVLGCIGWRYRCGRRQVKQVAVATTTVNAIKISIVKEGRVG